MHSFCVQFSRSVVSDSLPPHELQHARPPCPSPTPGIHPNPCPLSWWCHPTISSSVAPFFSCPQSFPASGSFQMSQLFTSGGQTIGSFSFNISPSNEHPGLISFRMDWLDLLTIDLLLMDWLDLLTIDLLSDGLVGSPYYWSPFGWTGWISLLSKGLSRVCCNSAVQKHQLFSAQPCITTGKTIALSIQTFVVKVISLLFNTLSRFSIAVLPRSKC